MRAVLRRGWLPAAGAGGLQLRGPPRPSPRTVDLRSDTVTRPCAGMRRAMARAVVGDDDYGEDAAVNELQRLAAGVLGMEEALFVPTATMANLIAVMCHCQRRGAQLLLGRDTHLHLFEHGGAAQVAGVHSQALPDLPDGTFDLDQLELTIREAHGSRYHPRPELLCLENTHSSAGGRALPLTYLQQVRGLADRYGLRVHMDGARLMNAAVAQDVEPARITQHCDSVTLCFSKGLGAPAGAVLAGCRGFVAEAWRVRKLLGGGMRQAGVLAAAAHLGLQQAEVTLRRDHSNARRFAEGCRAGPALSHSSAWAQPHPTTPAGLITPSTPQHCQGSGSAGTFPGQPGIQQLNLPLCSINLAAVETNIVMVSIRGGCVSPTELCEHLQVVSKEEMAETGQAVSVLLLPWSTHTVRAVWHRDVSAHDTDLAKSKLEFVARKCQEKLALDLHPPPPSVGGAQ